MAQTLTNTTHETITQPVRRRRRWQPTKFNLKNFENQNQNNSQNSKTQIHVESESPRYISHKIPITRDKNYSSPNFETHPSQRRRSRSRSLGKNNLITPRDYITEPTNANNLQNIPKCPESTTLVSSRNSKIQIILESHTNQSPRSSTATSSTHRSDQNQNTKSDFLQELAEAHNYIKTSLSRKNSSAVDKNASHLPYFCQDEAHDSQHHDENHQTSHETTAQNFGSINPQNFTRKKSVTFDPISLKAVNQTKVSLKF